MSMFGDVVRPDGMTWPDRPDPIGQRSELNGSRMDSIICRVFHGEATESEHEVLRAWRRESPENENHYRDFVRLLEEARDAVWDEVAGIPAPAVDVLLDPTLADGGVVHRERRVRRFWSDRRVRGAFALAAAIACFILVSQWFQESGDSGFYLGTGEIVTGPSEMSTVRLGDGSVVRLAPESRLLISNKPGTREVWLDGRAYFAVRHHDAIPFVVRSHAGDAVVLGTRFDIQATPEDLRVIVVEGAVQLNGREAESGGVEVAARQVGRVAGSATPVLEDADDAVIARELGWVGDFLVFEGTPLRDVAREMSEHYGVRVRILDGALEDETVSGLFVKEELGEVVEILCRALGAHCSITTREVLIGP